MNAHRQACEACSPRSPSCRLLIRSHLAKYPGSAQPGPTHVELASGLARLWRWTEDVHHPPARRPQPRLPAGRPAAVLAQDPARKPAPQRERPVRPQGRTSRPWRKWDPKAEPDDRDRVHPGPRAAAGLHRRARASWTSPPCATPWPTSAATRARSTRSSRASWSSTTRCRWTTSARPQAFANNAKLEYERNQERYTFLRWGQNAFRNFKVVPPETGIVHQVNLEYLARVVFVDEHWTAPTRTRWSAPTRTRR